VAWMYPDARCDRNCLYLCTKGFTQFPECATTLQQRKPLTDEQIDNAIRDDGNILLDHIYEYGTSAEGVTERLRSIARAAINAVENTKGD
jgi:hypothetical protein